MSFTKAQWSARILELSSDLSFSKFRIKPDTVFHLTEYSFAFTNLKPVIPGHVLVSPLRVVSRMSDLSTEEAHDLFDCVRLTGKTILSAHPHADSLTVTIQDGPNAGQSVEHLHFHIMPRWKTDRFNICKYGNDTVYEAIDKAEQCMERVDAKSSDPPRTEESMVAEGLELRRYLLELLPE